MFKKTTFLLILVFSCQVGSFLSAATYYAAQNGNDSNTGTLKSSWKTLGNSLSKLSPGDVLNLRGGHYYEANISTGLDGTASAPITIQSYPGEWAVIDGGVPYFKDVPNKEWEPVNAGINLYRSVRGNFPGNFVQGLLLDYDIQLFEYNSLRTRPPDGKPGCPGSSF